MTMELSTRSRGVDASVEGLINASARGLMDDVKHFLLMGVPANASNNHTTALGRAASKGKSDCVSLLLAYGADPNLPGARGKTPIMEALENRHQNCVDLLVRHRSVDLNTMDLRKSSVIMYAARSGFLPLSLMIRGQNTSSVLARDDFNESVLSYAAKNAHVQYLVRMTALTPFINEMVRAVVHNDVTRLQLLLTNGHDPNESDFNGFTPLIISVMLDRGQCLDILLDEEEVDLEKEDSAGRHAIHYAASCGHVRCIEKLISNGALVSAIDRNRTNALMLAAKSGSYESVAATLAKLLIERDLFAESGRIVDSENPLNALPFSEDYADSLLCCLDGIDYTDKTALMYASEGGHLEIVKVLLENGASVHRTSRKLSKNALMCSSGYGHLPVVNELVNRGAIVNLRDSEGYSALCYAARENRVPCVISLMEAGATITMRDTKGIKRSAAFIAIENGHVGVVDTMLQMSPCQANWIDSSGKNGLLYSAMTGNVESLKLFHKAGVSSMSTDYHDNTPLILASGGGYFRCMSYLVEQMHVQISTVNTNNRNALTEAVFKNLPLKIVQYLVNAGAGVNDSDIETGTSPLLHACAVGNKEYVNALLLGGADHTQVGLNGKKAIVIASENGSVQIVKTLIKIERERGGPDFDFTYANALAHAIESHRSDVVHAFLELGCFDWTWFLPIFLSNQRAAKMLLKYLVTFGISPSSPMTIANQLTSPLFIALYFGIMPLVNYLICNLYFTEQDYFNILRNSQLRFALEERTSDPVMRTVSEELYNRPLPLATLSFLKISSVIGDGNGLLKRSEAVNSLPIPGMFKRKLSFQEPVACLCVDEWDDIDLLSPARCRGGGLSTVFLKVTQRTFPPESARQTPCTENSACNCQGAGYTLQLPPGEDTPTPTNRKRGFDQVS